MGGKRLAGILVLLLPWPLVAADWPTDSPVRIAGVLGEYRQGDEFAPGQYLATYHSGIDIPAANPEAPSGTRVRAVVSDRFHAAYSEFALTDSTPPLNRPGPYVHRATRSFSEWSQGMPAPIIILPMDAGEAVTFFMLDVWQVYNETTQQALPILELWEDTAYHDHIGNPVPGCSKGWIVLDCSTPPSDDRIRVGWSYYPAPVTAVDIGSGPVVYGYEHIWGLWGFSHPTPVPANGYCLYTDWSLAVAREPNTPMDSPLPRSRRVGRVSDSSQAPFFATVGDPRDIRPTFSYGTVGPHLHFLVTDWNGTLENPWLGVSMWGDDAWLNQLREVFVAAEQTDPGQTAPGITSGFFRFSRAETNPPVLFNANYDPNQPPVVWGPVDAYVRCLDLMGFEKPVGVYGVGYWIEGAGSADYGSPQYPLWLAEAFGRLDYQMAFWGDNVVYVHHGIHQGTPIGFATSVNDNYWYCVTNTARAWDAHWPADESQSSPGSSAQNNDDARFPGGRYAMHVVAKDRLQTTEESASVLVDNFAPYVEEVEVWSLETGRTAWRARWNPQGDGSNLLSVLQEEAVSNARLGFRVKFSEYITGPGLPDYLEIGFHRAGGGAEYAGEVTIPVDEYCREFSGEVEQVQGSPSVTQAPFGRYQVRIRARDSAGNYLDITPASPARRNTNGTWSDAGYDPAADNPDTSHSFTVAPTLWAVEGHSDHTYDLVGYRRIGGGLQEGVRTSLPFQCSKDPPYVPVKLASPGGPEDAVPRREDWAPLEGQWHVTDAGEPRPESSRSIPFFPRAHVASDPKDGSCFVYGYEEGAGVIRRASPSGQLLATPQLPTPAGNPVWLQLHHESRTCYAIGFARDGCGDGSLGLSRYTRVDDNTWTAQSSPGIVAGPEVWFGSASLDQESGDIWMCYGVYGYDIVWEVVVIDGQTLALSTPFPLTHPAALDTWCPPQVAAHSADGTVWVATHGYDGTPPDILHLEYCITRYGSSGQNVQLYTVFDIPDEYYYLYGSAGVCDLPTGTDCVSAFLGSHLVPHPMPGNPNYHCPVPVGTFARLGTDGTHDSQSIAIPGCGASFSQSEEYVDNCHFAPTVGENGVYWVRHHMPGDPLDPDNCQFQQGVFTYTADVYFLSGSGQGGYVQEQVASVDFPGMVLDNHHAFAIEYLEPYGMSCISACAGAKWLPEEPRAATAVVRGAGDATTAVDSPALKGFTYRLGGVHPNPCNGCPGLSIEYSLAGASEPRFDLYNLAGQVVRTMRGGSRPAGEYSTSWDVLDFTGKRVPPATYILQMRTNEFVARTPVVVIR